MLEVPDVVYGIHPEGGSLDASVICQCPDPDNPSPPTSKVRKEVELHAEWKEEMLDLTSAEFIAFKKDTEQKVT